MTIKPRAITVCVEYDDLLAITLPRNLKHFSDFMVVTSSDDKATQELARKLGVKTYVTDSFYHDGATFNKWKALEKGLDAFGRKGWMCLLDSDVIWPDKTKWCPEEKLDKDFLYTPRRRIQPDITAPIIPYEDWHRHYSVFKEREFAGYTQIFHASSPFLKSPPWHEINWAHAGGADSFFQNQWPQTAKVRPPWSVLHLGLPGVNWCGRVTERVDGTLPSESLERAEKLRGFILNRISTGSYQGEKLLNDGEATVSAP